METESVGSKNGPDILALAGIVLLRKRLIALFVFVGCVLAVGLLMILKPSYTADATFFPPNSMSSNSSTGLGQVGQISALSGAGALAGLKDPSLIYIGLLGSRGVADDLIRQFDLPTVYKTTKLSDTEKALAAHTKFIPGKDMLVAVSVVDRDPKRAAAIANAYLNELTKQSDRLALTEAAQRRAFFERQLEREKGLLADAEVELTRMQETTGFIRPAGQAELEMGTIAQTQAAISSREVALAALSQGATEQNAEVVRIRSEIEGLKQQQARLENSKGKSGPGSILVPTAKVPQLTLDYVRAEREVKYHEALYDLLLRQFESAKLDESHAAPMIQVVDYAVTPDTKSWPPRTLLVVSFAIVGGLLGVVWVLACEAWKKMIADPVLGERLRSLKHSALRGR